MGASFGNKLSHSFIYLLFIYQLPLGYKLHETTGTLSYFMALFPAPRTLSSTKYILSELTATEWMNEFWFIYLKAWDIL